MTYPTKKIGEICDVFTDGDWIETKDQSSSGIRLIQTGNIGEGVFIDKDNRSRFISEQTFKRLNCTEIFAGDILISRLPDPIGRACILPKLPTRMITAVDCTIVRTNREELLPEFFLLYANSAEYYDQLAEFLSGSTRTRISRGNLAKIEIPVPPISEQKRIVAKIEKSFAKIDEAARLRANSEALAEKLLPAALHEIFSSAKSRGWEEKELGEICEDISNIKWYEKRGKDFQYIDLSSVSIETSVISNTKLINSDTAPSRAKKIVKTHDVIFGTTRPTLMRVAVVPVEYDASVCSTGFTVLRADVDYVLPEFIYHFLKSNVFIDRMEKIQTGASYPAVSDVKVLETKIPLPSLAEQKKIVKKLNTLAEKARALRDLQSSQSTALKSLKQSIFHEAFAT